MRTIQISTGAFDPAYGMDKDDSEQVMMDLLAVLVRVNRRYLRKHPECPRLYESNVTYRRETTVEEFNSIPVALKAGGADCFPVGTVLLRDDYTLIPVEELHAGVRIWGRDKWSTVERVWYKGILELDAIRLNNGSTVKLTPDHHAYVAVCREHEHSDRSKPCWCRLESRDIRRISVADLEPDMVLVVPERLPFGTEVMDPDRAYVEGLYIADGWCSHNAAFSIAGKDGHPKEEQKREVEVICERLGLSTHQHERYITVKDAEWVLRMQQMGGHAWEKHALSINLDEGAAGQLLRGIMADSGINRCGSRTFTTTSRQLAMQVRVLHRMFGVSCGYSYIEDHGGLGDHPIWRLSTREPKAHAEKLLRVKEIERSVLSAPCWDIATDDHCVYLPEHDVTVSNCDDLAPWRVAELIERDHERARIFVTCSETSDGLGEPKRLYHIRVKRADGTIEDPSEVLGMHRALPDGWQPVDGVDDLAAARLATKLWRLQRQGVATAQQKIVELRRRARRGEPEALALVHILAQIRAVEGAR